jgi:hypothetical protein
MTVYQADSASFSLIVHPCLVLCKLAPWTSIFPLSLWSYLLICWWFHLPFWNTNEVIRLERESRKHIFIRARRKLNWTISAGQILLCFLLRFSNQFSDHVFFASVRLKDCDNSGNQNNIFYRRQGGILTCTSMLRQMSAEHKMKRSVGCGSCLWRACGPIHCLRPACLSSQVPITYQEKVSSTSRPPTTCISKAR